MWKPGSQHVPILTFFPFQDLTYAVSVNKTKKEVLLVFRGAITKSDWAHATNWYVSVQKCSADK